jgi:hypothetical protein
VIRSTRTDTYHLSFAGRCGACGVALSAGTEVKRDPGSLWPTCLACASGTSLPPLRLMGPAAVARWRTGDENEVFVTRRLEKHLSGHGCIVLHDRRIPGHGAANIDHVVIGPGGVTVVDTKRSAGRVRVQTRGGLFSRRPALLVDGHDRSHLVAAVRREVAYVSGALDRAGLSVDVRGTLCFTVAEGLPWGRQWMDGILVDGPRRVARLARRRGRLDDTGVELVARAVADAFPPA